MEPLLLRDYSKIAPLQIQAYNATVRIDYKDMPLEPIVPEITSSNDCSSSVSKHREGLEEMEADSPSNTPSKGITILMKFYEKLSHKLVTNKCLHSSQSPERFLDFRLSGCQTWFYPHKQFYFNYGFIIM